MKSEVAQAAQQIKAELKANYPTVKFSVRSESFSMGNAVRISWHDGPMTKEVDAIVGKYQYGHFDGMQDLYENTNMRSDIPQAKYVQTSRQISEETRMEIATELGIPETELNQWNEDHNENNSTLIWREFSKRSFLEPKKEEIYPDELPIFQETAQAESDATTKENEPVVESVEMYCKAALACLSQISIFPADIETAKKYIRQAIEFQKSTL
jgi:hypothetical protein